MTTQQESKLSWKAPEFKHYQKKSAWYIVLIAVSLLIIGFFVYQKDYFAAVTLAIISVLVVLFSRHQPQDVQIELTNKGIHFGNLFFPYKQVKHFWVVHNESHKTVNLETTTYLNNIIILELSGQNPEKVRTYLRQYLPEHEETEGTSIQKIMHNLRF